ncbi:MAG: septum formation family protein [Kineosporiaceae bacterium]
MQIADLKPGQCVLDPGKDLTPYHLIEVVPCSRPHGHEFVTMLSLPRGPYPGDKKVETAAFHACDGPAGRAMTKAHRDPQKYAIVVFTPNERAWQFGDRGVPCFVTSGGDGLLPAGAVLNLPGSK